MKRRGLTLLEVIITLFTLGLALTMVASVVRQSGRLGQRTEEKDRYVNRILTLETIREEASQATLVREPSGSNPSPLLSFVRPMRLMPPSTKPPLPPFRSDELERVEYQMEEGRLFRTVTRAGVERSRQVVAENLGDFQAFLDPEGLLTLRISDQDGDRLRVYDVVVTRWSQ